MLRQEKPVRVREAKYKPTPQENYGEVKIAYNTTRRETAGMLRIAVSQMAWEGCAAIHKLRR